MEECGRRRSPTMMRRGGGLNSRNGRTAATANREAPAREGAGHEPLMMRCPAVDLMVPAADRLGRTLDRMTLAQDQEDPGRGQIVRGAERTHADAVPVGKLKRMALQVLAAAGAIAPPVHATLMPTEGLVLMVHKAVGPMGPEEEVDPVREHQTGRGAHRECLGTKRLRQDGAVALDQMLRSGPEVVSGGVAVLLLAPWVSARRKTAGRDVMDGPNVDDNSPAGQAASEVPRRAADGLEWPLGSAVQVAMVDMADRVALDSAALAGQWASAVGEGPGPADAVEAECATALDRAGLPEVPDRADRAASDPGGSVADRVRVASLACDLVSVLVMVAGLDRRGVEALVLIAALPASDRAVSAARRGWGPVEVLAAPAALPVRALMARDVMGGDSDLDRDSPASKVREA
jgi:hypothetical protein